MLTFEQFIREEFKTFFDSMPIYANPTKSELSEIFKGIKGTGGKNQVRWLSIAPTKTVYVWDANQKIHLEVFLFLEKLGLLPGNVKKFNDYQKVVGGVANLEGGSLYYDSSDELGFFADEIAKKSNQRQKSVSEMIPFWMNHIGRIIKAHEYVEKYIQGWTAPTAPLPRIMKRLYPI